MLGWMLKPSERPQHQQHQHHFRFQHFINIRSTTVELI